jgi:phospholipase/carboxylesterase
VSFELVTRTYSTSQKPIKAIIAIHGWKGDEYVFEQVAKLISLENSEWFFPRAPYKADSGNGNSWLGGNDEVGWKFDKTFNGINDLINKIQKRGYSPSKIFLIGFSQGACIAIDFALRLPFSIGGIISIAGFIKFKKRFLKDATKESTRTPILLMHGNQDDVIPVKAGKTTNDILVEKGYPTHFDRYDAKHKIPLKKMNLINKFINDPSSIVKSNNLNSIDL